MCWTPSAWSSSAMRWPTRHGDIQQQPLGRGGFTDDPLYEAADCSAAAGRPLTPHAARRMLLVCGLDRQSERTARIRTRRPRSAGWSRDSGPAPGVRLIAAWMPWRGSAPSAVDQGPADRGAVSGSSRSSSRRTRRGCSRCSRPGRSTMFTSSPRQARVGTTSQGPVPGKPGPAECCSTK